MENAIKILEEAGPSIDNLAKTTMILTEMNDFEKFNETYESYFSGPYPVRSAFEGATLGHPCTVKIESLGKNHQY